MHTPTLRRPGVVVVLALALCAPAAVAADPGLKAETEALEWVTGGVESTQTDIDTTVPGPAQAVAAASLPAGGSTTSSNAVANFGFVEVTTQSTGVYSAPPGKLINAQSISNATFRDDGVVVQAPGYGPGDFGAFTARFELNQDVEFTTLVITDIGGRVDIVGGYDLDVHIGGASPGPFNGQWLKSTTGAEQTPMLPQGIIEVPVAFEYGVPFTISAELEINLFVSALNGINAVVDASMNLGSAFFWQGIDTEGLPEGFTISSDNVRDWSKPYPENIPAPGTIALLPLGAAALARRRRRG